MPVTDYIEATETLLNRMVYWLFKPVSAIEGAATQAHSGAIASIKAGGMTGTPGDTGYLVLQNSAGEAETVEYSAKSLADGVCTFTVSATLKYSYAKNDLVAACSSAYTAWNVYKYSGTSEEGLFNVLADCQTPAAIVFYQGSDYRRDPRRTLKASVIVLAENYGDAEAGMLSARSMLDGVVAAIDEKTFNQTIMWVRSDSALDLGNPGIAAYQIDFEGEDH